MGRKIRLITPGEMLLTEWLDPLSLSQNRLARELFVPPAQVNDIVKGRRRITTDMALRLGRYFGNTAQFWMNMQQHYDLERAKERIGDEIEQRVIPRNQQEPVSA